MKDRYFIALHSATILPDELNDPFGSFTPEICRIAAEDIQVYIQQNEQHWQHDFGHMAHENTEMHESVKGKMFGVLVVKNNLGELGYLATYSGKLTGEREHSPFVPSQFDITANDHFISKGMKHLSQISSEIKNLEQDNVANQMTIKQLKTARKNESIELQDKLFSQYSFVNQAGLSMSLIDIFKTFAGRKPAAGSGECAGPKLLQYAFKNAFTPVAMSEFWWGKTKKTTNRLHGAFYPACEQKCRPILTYMLA
jgi:tRNA pseudouridine32 synthase/23S rRNA pseudouridine746 synthase